MATHAVKTKLSTSIFKAEIKSAYAIYLDSLAPTGRKSMKTLLHQCASILGHQKPIERFDWSTLTFEKVHLIRSAFTEAGYAVNSINLALAGLKGIERHNMRKTHFHFIGRNFPIGLLPINLRPLHMANFTRPLE